MSQHFFSFLSPFLFLSLSFLTDRDWTVLSLFLRTCFNLLKIINITSKKSISQHFSFFIFSFSSPFLLSWERLGNIFLIFLFCFYLLKIKQRKKTSCLCTFFSFPFFLSLSLFLGGYWGEYFSIRVRSILPLQCLY